ncbi:hypothetical protein FQA47_021285 [Oryzias melastigma]|uniref:Uncharacterized protein n=1 Tax=Oryzias melastigma TaxID=30732 RepID=A0A834FPT1_ORYME|nr:hypothetical protein FQA47_021285 [Oryzias melastigma]
MARLDCVHGAPGLRSWRAWIAFMARLDCVHGAPGLRSWRAWITFMARLDYVHGAPGLRSLRAWATFMARLDYVHCAPGLRSWPAWTAFIVRLDYVHGAPGLRSLRDCWTTFIPRVEIEIQYNDFYIYPLEKSTNDIMKGKERGEWDDSPLWELSSSISVFTSLAPGRAPSPLSLPSCFASSYH